MGLKFGQTEKFKSIFRFAAVRYWKKKIPILLLFLFVVFHVCWFHRHLISDRFLACDHNWNTIPINGTVFLRCRKTVLSSSKQPVWVWKQHCGWWLRSRTKPQRIIRLIFLISYFNQRYVNYDIYSLFQTKILRTVKFVLSYSICNHLH